MIYTNPAPKSVGVDIYLERENKKVFPLCNNWSGLFCLVQLVTRWLRA